MPRYFCAIFRRRRPAGDQLRAFTGQSAIDLDDLVDPVVDLERDLHRTVLVKLSLPNSIGDLAPLRRGCRTNGDCSVIGVDCWETARKLGGALHGFDINFICKTGRPTQPIDLRFCGCVADGPSSASSYLC